VITAVHTLGGAVDSLPPVEDAEFTPRVTAILADLRKLEAVAARATRISQVTPALIKALGAVRRQIDELTMLGATAPWATLGQRVCHPPARQPDHRRNRPSRRRFRG
jgi:uncharacterized protein HemX